MLQKGVDEVGDDDDDDWEPVEPNTSPCDSISGYRGLSTKNRLNRRPGASMCRGGGTQFSPNTSHELWKRTVNATLAMGYQADLAHYYKFHILQQICSTQYFTILFRDWGRRRTARINSWRYRKDSLVKIRQDRESRLLDSPVCYWWNM